MGGLLFSGAVSQCLEAEEIPSQLFHLSLFLSISAQGSRSRARARQSDVTAVFPGEAACHLRQRPGDLRVGRDLLLRDIIKARRRLADLLGVWWVGRLV